MNKQNLDHCHLILTMKLGKIANKWEKPDWEQFLSDITKEIGMTPLAEPEVYYCGDDGNEGYTGVQVITTSHVSFHYWERDNLLQMDIYSCKDFDAKIISKLLRKRFIDVSLLSLPLFLDRNPLINYKEPIENLLEEE